MSNVDGGGRGRVVARGKVKGEETAALPSLPLTLARGGRAMVMLSPAFVAFCKRRRKIMESDNER